MKSLVRLQAKTQILKCDYSHIQVENIVIVVYSCTLRRQLFLDYPPPDSVILSIVSDLVCCKKVVIK